MKRTPGGISGTKSLDSTVSEKKEGDPEGKEDIAKTESVRGRRRAVAGRG
ncbi:hypothetical protein BVRB_5g108830 [Beta vulgaris subsp. vulgaris]|nr:hypothetical protein BVRB_5g108830 [Beta vulgaris subsp. vulgaris]